MTTGLIEPQRRSFGSGKPVSLFTLGTMRALQSPGQLEAVVEAAIAAGINHLETAPAYGPSQRYVGQAIRRLGLSPCLLYTSPSPRDRQKSRMPSSA